jgi:small subunit ribosomal protein S3
VGQKVHPKGLRVGVVKDWDTKWYANKKNFSDLLVEDVKIRKFVKKALYNSGVSRIEIERTANNVKVTVHTAKPGMVIGKAGAGIADLQKALGNLTGKTVNLNVVEIRAAEVDAQLVAESIAQQLEKRIAFRRATKQAVQKAMRLGAKGIRIIVSGRIGGAEIAREERISEGTVPLHTLRADIDYGFAEADTTFGKIGVKCYIYAGDKINYAAAGDRGFRGERRGGERGGERGRGGRRGNAGGNAGGERPSRPAPQNDRAAIAAGPKPVNREGGAK